MLNPSCDTVTVRIDDAVLDAPVAQLDRALVSEAEGCGFKSRRAHHFVTQSAHDPHANPVMATGALHCLTKSPSDVVVRPLLRRVGENLGRSVVLHQLA